MVDFGLALKIYRASRSISQSELVGILTTKDPKLSGVDVVTISRWENGVVMPSHKRQVDVFSALGYCYFDFINHHRDVIKGECDFPKIKKAYAWETSYSVKVFDINYQKIKLKMSEDDTEYCLLYSDTLGVPVGHVNYKLIDKVGRRNNLQIQDVTEINSEKKLIIKYIFCLGEEIAIHMLGLISRCILTGSVKSVEFLSGNKKSAEFRFLKSLGFKSAMHNVATPSISLSYYDVVFNQELFNCTLKLIHEGVIHENC